MPIPDYQSWMLPLLKLAADKKEHTLRGAVEDLADEFQLSEAERKELLPSGKQTIIHNRVGWSRTYMTKAGLLEATRRGCFRITERGLQALAEKPARIDIKWLNRYPEFLEFKAIKREAPEQLPDLGIPEGETPEESLERSYEEIRGRLAGDLLDRVKASPSGFFEQLVVDLLVAMGYGGSTHDAGKALGRSGDGGIDGIIKEDKLGLDAVYIQAKRWDGTVGRPEIQKFAGALQGARARKGVFITTSAFTKDAEDYVTKIESKIVLIDGQRLCELMIDHGVGVTTAATYEIKRVDSDYFGDE